MIGRTKTGLPVCNWERSSRRNRLVEMGSSGETVEASSRRNVVGNLLLCRSRTTLSEETLLRGKHCRRSRRVYRNPNMVEIRFPCGHDREVTGR